MSIANLRLKPEEARGRGITAAWAKQPREDFLRGLRSDGLNLMARQRALRAFDYEVKFDAKLSGRRA